MSFPTPPDDRGYSRYCSACGGEIHHCNLYGMGTCLTCGFKDRPAQDDNNERARLWREEHPVSRPNDEPGRVAPSLTDANANDLINAIRDGSWDIYLNDISAAITERKADRRNEVQALVEQVYGPTYTITAKR